MVSFGGVFVTDVNTFSYHLYSTAVLKIIENFKFNYKWNKFILYTVFYDVNAYSYVPFLFSFPFQFLDLAIEAKR
jgi:hypothetical protein